MQLDIQLQREDIEYRKHSGFNARLSVVVCYVLDLRPAS